MENLKFKTLICTLAVSSIFSSVSAAETESQVNTETEIELSVLESLILECAQRIDRENINEENACAVLRIRQPIIRPNN